MYGDDAGSGKLLHRNNQSRENRNRTTAGHLSNLWNKSAGQRGRTRGGKAGRRTNQKSDSTDSILKNPPRN